MDNSSPFWEAWAPYWSYLEDNHLDLDSINRLSSEIEGPVLVVGAGQGLLVEQLQKRGIKTDGIDLEPLMIEYAQKRRGLTIIQADGSNMPFPDNSYKMTIIATGVIDYMVEKDLIKSILNESIRVTNKVDGVIVAFYRFHPKVEQLLKFLGLITDQGSWRAQRTYEMSQLKHFSLLKAIKRESNTGTLRALVSIARIHLFMPKKEKKATKNWDKIWRLARKEHGTTRTLTESVPESVPYRNEDCIRALFSELELPVRKIFDFGTCYIVRFTQEDSHKSIGNN
jgi:ubiquinone/menaquinone biosynthesis C-methylase UbiE